MPHTRGPRVCISRTHINAEWARWLAFHFSLGRYSQGIPIAGWLVRNRPSVLLQNVISPRERVLLRGFRQQGAAGSQLPQFLS